MIDTTIRLLTADDAELLSELAISIYKQHYLHLWDDNGVWYIEQSYNLKKIHAELADLNNFHYIAWVNHQPIGYLKLRMNEKIKGPVEQQGLEVERIYIAKEFCGLGLGKKLMKVAFEIAKYHNQETVFLKAMDSSEDALAFYEKMGFEKSGTLTLPFEQMKKEYRGMVVLVNRASASPLQHVSTSAN